MMRQAMWVAAAVAVLISPLGCAGQREADSAGAAGKGTMRTLKLDDGDLLTVGTVFEDDFSGDMEHWLAEGTPRVAVADGRLSIDAARGVPHVATVWCRQEFEGDAVIEYTVRIEPALDAKGHGETNMNFSGRTKYSCSSRKPEKEQGG